MIKSILNFDEVKSIVKLMKIPNIKIITFGYIFRNLINDLLNQYYLLTNTGRNKNNGPRPVYQLLFHPVVKHIYSCTMSFKHNTHVD